MNKIILDIINKQLDGNAYDLLSKDEYEILGYWLATQEDKGVVEEFNESLTSEEHNKACYEAVMTLKQGMLSCDQNVFINIPTEIFNSAAEHEKTLKEKEYAVIENQEEKVYKDKCYELVADMVKEIKSCVSNSTLKFPQTNNTSKNKKERTQHDMLSDLYVSWQKVNYLEQLLIESGLMEIVPQEHLDLLNTPYDGVTAKKAKLYDVAMVFCSTPLKLLKNVELDWSYWK